MTTSEIFRSLHRPGAPFVLANAWDLGSARVLVALGAEAIATSSSAHAFGLGRPDGALTRDEALAHGAAMAAAVNVPVQADLENGFGDSPEHCAETVVLAARAGLAGLCLEDIALPSDTPYGFDLAVARMEAAARAARAEGIVLTARADGVLRGQYDLAEAIRRLRAFAAAGAEVLYAPMVGDVPGQRELIAAVGAPVNVLAVGEYAALPQTAYAQMGAARISLGSGLARVAQQALLEAAGPILAEGDFSALARGADGAAVDAMLAP